MVLYFHIIDNDSKCLTYLTKTEDGHRDNFKFVVTWFHIID